MLLLNRLCFVLVANIFATLGQPEGQYFILRNPHSGHVIDTSEDFVTLQRFTGFTSQQWRLEASKRGMYYVINRATRKLLDLDYRYPVSNSWVVVSNRIGVNGNNCPKYDGSKNTTFNIDACQQWFFNYEGLIINGCGRYAIDIRKDNYTPGVYLETYEVTGKDNQKFQFQYV